MTVSGNRTKPGDSPLRPLFVRCASPEAIEAELRAASAREHAAAREVNALLALLRERIEQIAVGTWPPESEPIGWICEGPHQDAGPRLVPVDEDCPACGRERDPNEGIEEPHGL